MRFAVARAEATQAAADRRPGRMAALLGATPAQLAAATSVDGCWLANDNAPGQAVVAGTPEGVDAAIDAAKALGLRKAVPLSVDGAFHTQLMAGARADLQPVLASLTLSPPAAPVVSNGDALAHRDGAGWRVRLADHLVSPVRWRDSLTTLAGLAEGFVEVGPGGLLSGMARRTVPASPIRNVAVPADAALLVEVP
jgi:[acyl-carrier-protein] S-malonyltransferase